MKCDQDLCLNFWYDLRMLLWQDELNPRVRCAFGNVFFSSQTAECFDSEIAEIFGPSPIGITIILIFYLSSWNCEACKKCLNSYNPKRQIDLEIRNMLVFFSCYLHVYAFTGLF